MKSLVNSSRHLPVGMKPWSVGLRATDARALPRADHALRSTGEEKP